MAGIELPGRKYAHVLEGTSVHLSMQIVSDKKARTRQRSKRPLGKIARPEASPRGEIKRIVPRSAALDIRSMRRYN